MSLSSRGRFILKVTLGYALAGASWVLMSDQMLSRLANVQAITALASGKGLAFVAVTAALLALALSNVPQAEDDHPPTASRAPPGCC